MKKAVHEAKEGKKAGEKDDEKKAAAEDDDDEEYDYEEGGVDYTEIKGDEKSALLGTKTKKKGKSTLSRMMKLFS